MVSCCLPLLGLIALPLESCLTTIVGQPFSQVASALAQFPIYVFFFFDGMVLGIYCVRSIWFWLNFLRAWSNLLNDWAKFSWAFLVVILFLTSSKCPCSVSFFFFFSFFLVWWRGFGNLLCKINLVLVKFFKVLV